jgi:hypothetical protein
MVPNPLAPVPPDEINESFAAAADLLDLQFLVCLWVRE